jgi:hypothetical protein
MLLRSPALEEQYAVELGAVYDGCREGGVLATGRAPASLTLQVRASALGQGGEDRDAE